MFRRHHMNQGAMAIVTARAMRLGGSAQSMRQCAKDAELNHKRVSEAFAVLDLRSRFLITLLSAARKQGAEPPAVSRVAFDDRQYGLEALPSLWVLLVAVALAIWLASRPLSPKRGKRSPAPPQGRLRGAAWRWRRTPSAR
jgi:hypothetical protein